MIGPLLERMRQGFRTLPFPGGNAALPDRFRGVPVVDPSRCREGCRECAEVCPAEALAFPGKGPALDLGRCLFCGDCQDACTPGSLKFTQGFALAAQAREDLVYRGGDIALAGALKGRLRRLLGRSLKLRQVSAGGCNGCEADINVLSTPAFDWARFGIQVVASPRHADGLLVTGPVTANMRQALLETYRAVPEPKIVVAVGACAISGGPFRGLSESGEGVSALLPVDGFIPGCPPHPWTILDGLLRLMGRRKPSGRRPGEAK